MMSSSLHPHVHWDQGRGAELANAISHGAGLLCALVGGPFLVAKVLGRGGDWLSVIGVTIYCATLVVLYLGSTLYHAWPRTPAKSVLQVIDHSAIFLLIAGTYTPLTLGPLRGPWGWSILTVIWTLALGGIALKYRGGLGRPKLSLALYLGMGWLIVVAMKPLANAVPAATLVWLGAGGVAYTAGVVFYVRDRRRAYNHFVWHLFVLTGTACHFCAIATCVT